LNYNINHSNEILDVLRKFTLRISLLVTIFTTVAFAECYLSDTGLVIKDTNEIIVKNEELQGTWKLFSNQSGALCPLSVWDSIIDTINLVITKDSISGI
jgi:hypothetical protein